MTICQTLLEKLHFNRNPYTGFPTDQWAGTWYNDPGATREIFKRAINLSKPGLIIEVGSFVGESTIFMANQLKARGKDAAILAVDTWCGGIDHWISVPEKLKFHFGRSSLYYQFVGNVCRMGMQNWILPLAFDSINAARLLTRLGIQADMIYVDASHEEGDVRRDLEAYWPLLKKGGVLLADDVNNIFPGVLKDVTEFMKDHDLKPNSIEGEKVLIVKV